MKHSLTFQNEEPNEEADVDIIYLRDTEVGSITSLYLHCHCLTFNELLSSNCLHLPST